MRLPQFTAEASIEGPAPPYMHVAGRSGNPAADAGLLRPAFDFGGGGPCGPGCHHKLIPTVYGEVWGCVCTGGYPGVCPPGWAFCGGACVNTATDANNCGGCGNYCPGECAAGQCFLFE